MDICAKIALVFYYLTYILWLGCASIIARTNLQSPKYDGAYWTVTIAQLITAIVCMLLILFCSKQHQKASILGQFGCSMGFLVLGFLKDSISDRASSVIEIAIVFTVGQSIALMLQTLNYRQRQRELQIANWIKIHPFTKTHRFSSVYTKKVIKEPPLHKISSKGMDEEELDFTKKVINEDNKVEESFNFNLFKKNSVNHSTKGMSQKLSIRSDSRINQNNSTLKKKSATIKQILTEQQETSELQISTNNEMKTYSTRKTDQLGQFGIFKHLESQENIPPKQQ